MEEKFEIKEKELLRDLNDALDEIFNTRLALVGINTVKIEEIKDKLEEIHKELCQYVYEVEHG